MYLPFLQLCDIILPVMSILIEKDYVTLTPAYGRDYTNLADAKSAFLNGKDFILQDVTSPWFGKLCNVMDFKKGMKARIRYNKMRRVVMVNVP